MPRQGGLPEGRRDPGQPGSLPGQSLNLPLRAVLLGISAAAETAGRLVISVGFFFFKEMLHI